MHVHAQSLALRSNPVCAFLLRLTTLSRTVEQDSGATRAMTVPRVALPVALPSRDPELRAATQLQTEPLRQGLAVVEDL